MTTGMLYHYYDPCDTKTRQHQTMEYSILKAFAEAGLLRLGEACAMECMEIVTPSSDRECQKCKEQKGLRQSGLTKCNAKSARLREPWTVPWQKVVPSSNS